MSANATAKLTNKYAGVDLNAELYSFDMQGSIKMGSSNKSLDGKVSLKTGVGAQFNVQTTNGLSLTLGLSLGAGISTTLSISDY